MELHARASLDVHLAGALSARPPTPIVAEGRLLFKAESRQ
jgi:hypothetical protein